jgi:hypothetical protein
MLTALTLCAACGRLGVELLPMPITSSGQDVLADANAGGDAGADGGEGMGAGAALDPCLAACSNPHGAAQCSAGTCVLTCNPGYTDCDGDGRNGCETNIASDPNHCGACNGACERDSELCADGSCEPSPCPAGRGECDGDTSLLCESDLTSSAQSCGFCGNVCAAAHGSSACRDRTCAITSCDPGYADCDASPLNGCETALNSVDDCGMCGRSCPANGGTPVCNAGTCGVSCSLTGAFALRLTIPASWPGTIAISAGSGTFTFWGLLQLSHTGTQLSGSFTPCGELVPDFSAAPLIGERYGLVFPNSIFDRTPLLPGVAATGSVSADAPGASLTLARSAFLLGAQLTDPAGAAWPAANATLAVDADGDGKTALSVPYKTGAGYTPPPVNNLGSFRSDTAYLATRIVFSLNGTLSSCTQSSGSVSAQDVDAHTLGCRVLGGRDCLALEATHLDVNTPDFRPSAGTYALQKLQAANCPAVRAALP